MADVEEQQDSRFDDVDLEKILARVERRGPLTFTRKRCLYRGKFKGVDSFLFEVSNIFGGKVNLPILTVY